MQVFFKFLCRQYITDLEFGDRDDVEDIPKEMPRYIKFGTVHNKALDFVQKHMGQGEAIDVSELRWTIIQIYLKSLNDGYGARSNETWGKYVTARMTTCTIF